MQGLKLHSFAVFAAVFTVMQAKSDKPDHEFAHAKEVVTSLVFNPKRDDQLLVVGSHVSRYDSPTSSTQRIWGGAWPGCFKHLGSDAEVCAQPACSKHS